MIFLKRAAAAMGICALGGLVHAVPLSVTSYDMPNGAGQANGGTFNYWDRNYTGSGSTTTDGAALTGGKGDLTDGVTTAQNWSNVENAAGTGPYVGWLNSVTPTPVVKFNFGSTVQINSVTVHLDDANTGGVSPPSSIDLSTDGVTFITNPISDPASTNPFSITLPFTATSGSIYVRFGYRTQWIFVDEVSFDGVRGTAIPEPMTPALFGAGLLVLGIARRRMSAA